MAKLQIIFILLCSVSVGLAIRGCSDPKPHYNQYINHPRAFKCKEGNTAQCVAATFLLCNAPNTGLWRKGLKVNSNCNKIPRNTAIASFSGSGGTTYKGSKGHAAIFLYCNADGSIRVADQWCGHKFSERNLPKPCKSSKPYSNCADYFYTMEW